MEDPSPVIFAALGVIFPAFSIWMTVRYFNRRKKLSARFCSCVMIVIAVGALSILIPYQREQKVIREIEGWGGRVERESIRPKWLRQLIGVEQLGVFNRVAVVHLDRST